MEEMEALAREAGLPEGLFAEVRVEVERVPDLIADPRVRAVTVTGSERAGSAVAAVAAEATVVEKPKGKRGKKGGGSVPIEVVV